MTDYALNKEEKKKSEAESPDCLGQVRNVWEIWKLWENLRTLRAFSALVKKQKSHRFSIKHKSSLESKNRVKYHKHTTKCLKLTLSHTHTNLELLQTKFPNPNT
jgi:hypothetical protein